MANWLSHRMIVEEHDVSNVADKFRKEYQRFDKAYEALSWILARHGNRVASLTRTAGGVDYHLYRQAGDPLAGTPDIIVLFTCDDDKVVLVAMNVEETQLEED